MGMNMVSKGVQNVLDFLQDDFPDMDVIGISGKFLDFHMVLLLLLFSEAGSEINLIPQFSFYCTDFDKKFMLFNLYIFY